jgi:hypothetical protein
MSAALGSTAKAAPENAAVVVNADSWASCAIANEYIAKRGIPPWNVIYLSGIPSLDSIPVAEFRQRILLPVLETLNGRGLSAQIDAILYSSDFPTMIDLNADVGKEQLPQVLTPYGSLTGCTYLYQTVTGKSPATMDLAGNFYVRRATAPTEDTPWSTEEREKYVKAAGQVVAAGQVLKSKAPLDGKARDKLKDAISTMEALAEKHPRAPELLYNLACGLVMLGRPEEAVANLQKAADTGWWEIQNAARDEDLAPLRSRPDFDKLLARLQQLRFDPQPAIAFRGAIGWSANGQPVPADKGRRYLLSTMLACTSGRGMSVRESLDYLRRSISSDGSRPRGTIYYMKNSDVRSQAREWGFEPAAAKLRALGFKAAVEQGVLPMNKSDVAGAMIGAEGFAWSQSSSKILPGAICDHLTSCGGMMGEGAPQTPLTELLRAGAAGASGTVSEPFAVQAKFPTPFLHVFYAQGCTLAEAFYQSVSGPYQLLIVGDALCRPWGKRINVTLEGVRAGQAVSGTVKLKARASSPDNLEVGLFELYIGGKRAFATKEKGEFEWDTTSAPDGPHELSVVASGNDPVTTQGRTVVPIEIRNGKDALTFTTEAGAEQPWSRPFEVQASAAGAKEIVIMQNVQPVGRIPGAKGKVPIDPRVLGLGPVRLRAVAVRDGEGPRQVVGKPLDMRIVPPQAMRPIAVPGGRMLIDDLSVRVDERFTTAKHTYGDWLEKAGVNKKTRFTVEGWFTVPADDVYQFQVQGNVKVASLAVDGHDQDWPRTPGAWWFVPVNLERGLHRVRITGQGVDQPTLEVRFGGPGSVHLEGSRFKHPE